MQDTLKKIFDKPTVKQKAQKIMAGGYQPAKGAYGKTKAKARYALSGKKIGKKGAPR